MPANGPNYLPKFPGFIPITLEYKTAFESIVHTFDEVYSDFNFNSLWTWNIKKTHRFSILNGNLVISLNDYITGEPVFSVLGTNQTDDTISKLIQYAKQNDCLPVLKMVPDTVVSTISNSDMFQVTEDPDNHDYLFSIDALSELSGRRFKSKRHAANRCAREGNISTHFDTNAIDNKKEIQSLLLAWERHKKARGKVVEASAEFTAIKRMLDTLDTQPNLLLSTARQSDKVVGFSIDEILSNGYALSHYFKTIQDIPGVSEFFNKEVAKHLKARGARIWNWEQDLGLTNLRDMKQSHRPLGVLKKYQIALKGENV